MTIGSEPYLDQISTNGAEFFCIDIQMTDWPIQKINNLLTCFKNIPFLEEEYTFSSEHGAQFVIFTIIYSV